MIKKRRALNTFSPVKANASLKCTLKIPGIFEQLSDHKIATGPQRQPHRIAKNEQPLARFSPRRDVYVCIYIYTLHIYVDIYIYVYLCLPIHFSACWSCCSPQQMRRLRCPVMLCLASLLLSLITQAWCAVDPWQLVFTRFHHSK